MNEIIIRRLIYSACFFLITHLCFYFLKRFARKTQQRMGIRKSRYFAIRRLLTIVSIMVVMGGLVFIWGLNLKNIWVTVSSALAVVAIAFFAVWSLVGNILAGMLIYFTTPFKVDDEIEVMPDDIRGVVLAVNTFYTVLEDAEHNYINVPNSLFFQKYIRVKSTVAQMKKMKARLSVSED